MHPLKLVGLAALTVGLAGCLTTTSGDVSNPIGRKLSWFSHVNGDDIRAACEAGAPDRFRLVHNANYMRRVRLVDGEVMPDGSLALKTRLLEPVELTSGIRFGSPASILAPWEGRVVQARLSPDQAAGLWTALDRDGLRAPAPAGTQLISQEFWWVAVACRGGAIDFQVWADAGRGYDGVTFPALLARLDGTETPIARPQDDPRSINPAFTDRDTASREVRFRMAIGRDGLNP